MGNKNVTVGSFDLIENVFSNGESAVAIDINN